jgi:hypothetical protein
MDQQVAQLAGEVLCIFEPALHVNVRGEIGMRLGRTSHYMVEIL